MSKELKKIILLGWTLRDEFAKELWEFDSHPQVMTHRFARSLAWALSSSFSRVELLSAAPVQDYPHCRKIIFRGGKFEVNGLPGHLLGFVNLTGIKHLSRLYMCLLELWQLHRSSKFDALLLHGTHTPFMFAAILHAHLTGVKLLICLTDEHAVVNSSDNWVRSTLKRIDQSLCRFLVNKFDGAMLLSNKFISNYSLRMPFVVFPGIIKPNLRRGIADMRKDNDHNNQLFIIGYSGSLTPTKGLNVLLDAFRLIDCPYLRLHICGPGLMKDRMKSIVAEDSRILFKGMLSDDELPDFLINCDLLINPADAMQTYSQSAFPSKILEYMACGRPILTTRIFSMPTEIKDYFYYIEDATAQGIKKSILDVMARKSSERSEMGERAKVAAVQLYSEEKIGSMAYHLLQKVSE